MTSDFPSGPSVFVLSCKLPKTLRLLCESQEKTKTTLLLGKEKDNKEHFLDRPLGGQHPSPNVDLPKACRAPYGDQHPSPNVKNPLHPGGALL